MTDAIAHDLTRDRAIPTQDEANVIAALKGVYLHRAGVIYVRQAAPEAWIPGGWQNALGGKPPDPAPEGVPYDMFVGMTEKGWLARVITPGMGPDPEPPAGVEWWMVTWSGERALVAFWGNFGANLIRGLV